MAAPRTPADDTPAEVPVACSLTRAGLAEQAGRWERLAALHGMFTGMQRARSPRQACPPGGSASGDARL